MKPDWWDINVNGNLLVAVNGKDTAKFMYHYLSKDTQNKYEIRFSEKNKLEEEISSESVKPLSPADLKL